MKAPGGTARGRRGGPVHIAVVVRQVMREMERERQAGTCPYRDRPIGG